MTDSANPTINGRQLYPTEQEKLDRLDSRLTAAFLDAGFSDVRICEGSGEGDHRKISFFRECDGSRLVSFTSLAFLGSTGEELISMITSHLRQVHQE